ncbi:MAG TPA: hypothetical protein VFY29_09030 [Terriglobia bacterium]|nr:hypothetical protein [Terriglobia bacterium]
MKEERTIVSFDRVPARRIWWSAIFAGTFFALGIMLLLGFFGLAVGAGATGPGGEMTQGITMWASIWSVVTAFISFFCGGWLAGRVSGTQAKTDGALHGLTVWGLGSMAIFYFAVTGTSRLMGLLALSDATLAPVAPGMVSAMTTSAAFWALWVAISGLIGAIAGGYSGGYKDAVSVVQFRRAA